MNGATVKAKQTGAHARAHSRIRNRRILSFCFWNRISVTAYFILLLRKSDSGLYGLRLAWKQRLQMISDGDKSTLLNKPNEDCLVYRLIVVKLSAIMQSVILI